MKDFKDVIIKEAEKIIEAEPYLRLGQTCYNLTHSLFPEIVNSLRGTALDCFDDNSKIDHFLNRVEQRVVEYTAEMERIRKEIEIEEPSNWRLPNKDELILMYENLHKKDIGGFADDYYWSSSEINSNYVWDQYFGSGFQYYRYKSYGLHVRTVRSFKLQEGDLYEIGQETETGYVFDIQRDVIFECKKEDEPELMNWYEAINKFGGTK